MVSAAARHECRGAHTVRDYERPIDDPVAPNGRNDAELDEAHAVVLAKATGSTTSRST